MDEGERFIATEHPAPDPRTWPSAVARLRRSVDRCLAEQRVEQRPERRHDALLHADDGSADDRGAKRWSETLGSLGAVSARVDTPDEAGGARNPPLGGGNLFTGARGRANPGDPR